MPVLDGTVTRPQYPYQVQEVPPHAVHRHWNDWVDGARRQPCTAARSQQLLPGFCLLGASLSSLGPVPYSKVR
jgi:hypothetical protein